MTQTNPEYTVLLIDGTVMKVFAPSQREAEKLARTDGHRVFSPVDEAQQIRGFIEDAVGDIASDMLSRNGGMVNDKWKKKIAAARKGGQVKDLHGWLADELYNDEGTLSDLIGDKVYEVSSNPRHRQAVLDELAEGHIAIKRVCEDLTGNLS